MKQFRVTSEKGYYFNCKVFDTKQEMYDYYLKYVGKRERSKSKDWEAFNFTGFDKSLQFAAIVMPFERLSIAEDGTETRMKNIGEALFYKGKLGIGLISHEMLHCALWHERLIEGNLKAEFGENIGEDEERLCYTLTDFVIQFCRKCYKLGFYK